MFKSKVKEYLIKIFDILGYKIIKRKQVLIDLTIEDPRILTYSTKLAHNLLNLPTELGIGKRYFPLTNSSYHPFIIALTQIGKIDNKKEYIFNTIQKYNQLVNLKNPNDTLGLNKEERIFSENDHPYLYRYPWSELLPHQTKKSILDQAFRENKESGLLSYEILNLNATDRKIEIETDRLFKVWTSIKKYGYRQSYKDLISCTVFVKGNNWKWYVEGGQHRVSALTALGYKHIPVKVKQIIRREDVKIWHAVHGKIYSEIEALNIFDKIYDANPPPIMKDWINYVNLHHKHTNSNLNSKKSKSS